MKTNKILLQRQYEDAKICKNSLSVQNYKTNYITLGTYGATITFLNKNGVVGEKHINDWRQFSYSDLCKKFDNTEFDLPF